MVSKFAVPEFVCQTSTQQRMGRMLKSCQNDVGRDTWHFTRDVPLLLPLAQ